MLEINKELEDYILTHTENEEQVLKDLSRETHVKMLRPRMLSGHLQGKFLKMICQMMNPKRVLEIGTYTGYSAISMAMGTSDDCVIHTIDCNDELEYFTRKFIKQSGCENKIEFHIGEALDIIPKLEEDFVVENQGNENGLIKLKLLPLEPETGLVLAFVWVDPVKKMMAKTLVVDFYGNGNEVSMTNIEIDPEVDDAMFEFTPPKGVDVEDNTLSQ